MMPLTVLSSGQLRLGLLQCYLFAVSVWNGKNFDDALHDAVSSGLQVGGVAFVTAVLAGQLTKAGAYGLVANTSEQIVRIMGAKGFFSSGKCFQKWYQYIWSCSHEERPEAFG